VPHQGRNEARANFECVKVVGFPNPVDEISARIVAAMVVVLSIATIATGWEWGAALICLGFLLRVVSGPTLSPLGQIATKVIRPRLQIDPVECPGPPKRFAQAIGFVVSGASALVWIVGGSAAAGRGILAVLVIAASLEAFAGFCLGCKMFAILMRLGVIPEPICERCASVGGAPAPR